MNRGIQMNHPRMGMAMITSYRKSIPAASDPSTSPPNTKDKGESHKVERDKPQDEGGKS
jgi:hypothetical protein